MKNPEILKNLQAHIRNALSYRQHWLDYRDVSAIRCYAFALGKCAAWECIAKQSGVVLPDDVRDSLAQFQMDYEDTGLNSILRK